MWVHFIAIGGSAMHNLALALANQGAKVTGSDDAIFEPSKSRLEARGLLPEKLGWDASRITSDIDVVILGMHAKADNPELLQAQELGLTIYSYPRKVAGILQRVIADALRESSMRDNTTLPGACVEYASGDTISQVMTTLDAALMAADEKQDSSVTLGSRHSGSVVPAREQASFWRNALSHALDNDGLLLEFFPVLTNTGKLYHQEGMVRASGNKEI